MAPLIRQTGAPPSVTVQARNVDQGEVITVADNFITGISGIAGAVASFKAATGAGFAISEDGGRELLRAIGDMLLDVERALFDAERLAQEPPLGTTPAAQVYKPFLATIATDPVQGFLPAVHGLRDDLMELDVEVKQAIALYQATDRESGHKVAHADGSIA
jgi:hypothetical protein